ncbi:SCP2 sterol-binding domain-containing protein [Pinisolibacter sp.]|uniref:SCP2 sterol-binding domain-containing protein n=1 Tax=Pinisolibacter sp. TaxID=2172024 RepID=UPI002FDEF348
MASDVLEAKLESVLPALSRVGAVVKFDLGDDGSEILDARSAPAKLVADLDVPPDCTIKITQDNLLKLLDGKLDPMLGYTLGKIKVAGSLGVAMKLIGALG